ncbi:MAG: hypothetical protein IJ867_00285 [Clostridia bacterium]|nr:hypothetical protein [Clostridia bacterium]
MDFDISTLKGINEYKSLLEEIKRKYQNITMPMIREYFRRETKIRGVSEELYSDLDKLYKLREETIQSASIQIRAQAQKAGYRLSNRFLTGKNLVPFYEDELYEKIPDLKLFEFLSTYTPEEIAQMRNIPGQKASKETTEEERV